MLIDCWKNKTGALQVVSGMDVVRAVGTLPSVKDNGESGYVKCAASPSYLGTLMGALAAHLHQT